MDKTAPLAKHVDSRDAPLEFSARRDFAADIKVLSQLNPYKTFGAILWDWAMIIAVAGVSVHFGSVFALVVAVLIIAGRQHALVGLMHEGAHRRLSANTKLNDWIGNYLVSYPLLLDMHDYRAHHLKHHLHLNSEQDPDVIRKTGLPDWQFPMSKREFAKSLARYLYGYGFIEWRMAKRTFSSGRPVKAAKDPAAMRKQIFRLTYYAAAAALITYFGAWSYVATFWLLPYALVFPIFQRIRSVAEHSNLPRTTELNQTRNVLSSRLEAFFMGPHNLGYHLDHHLFPTVPFYNLRALHERLMQNHEYRKGAHQNTSYILMSSKSVFQDLGRDYSVHAVLDATENEKSA